MSDLAKIETAGRFLCIVEAPSTTPAAVGTLLDTAFQAFTALSTANNNATGKALQKFRLVVMVGSRFDLIAKAMTKIKAEKPTWQTIVVQLQRRDRQTASAGPNYAVVAGPPGELTTSEPTVVNLPRACGHREFGFRLRCTNSQCQWRPESLRGEVCALAAEDASCEIDNEDKVNLMEDMLADLADAEEGDEKADDNDDLAEGDAEKRDAIVDLWPFARNPEVYKEVMTMVGAGVAASGAVLVTTSAHPSPWLACSQMVCRVTC